MNLKHPNNDRVLKDVDEALAEAMQSQGWVEVATPKKRTTRKNTSDKATASVPPERNHA